MKDKSSWYKRFSVFYSKLSEIAEAYGSSVEELIEIHRGCWEHDEEYQWSQICSANPEFKEANQRDKEKILELLSKIHEEKRAEAERKPLLDRIIQLVIDNCSLVHDQHNDGFAVLNTGINRKVIKLRSREFRFLVGKLVWDAEQKGISSEVLTSAINTLEGKAYFEGESVYLHNRVASYNGKIYYDLSDDAGRIIEIDKDGWRFITNSPVLFRREQQQKAQVEPKRGGDLKKIWKYVNLTSQSDRVLLLSCLAAMLFENIDHAIPVLYGEQGSGKTVSCECLKELLDPSSIKTMSLSRDEESLILALYHNWLSIFDNVSEVKEWQSDILSRAITGAGQSRRRRYTDEEEQLYNFRRCIAINGLVVPLTAPDVMDRSLLFKLRRFEQHGSREKLEREFEHDKPEILGGLFDLVSKALKIKEEQKIEAPPGIRLYDFAVIGEAVARAAGEREGLFLDLLLKKKAEDNLEVIQSSLMGSVLYSLISDGGYKGTDGEYKPFLDKEMKWEGSPSELLEIFNLKAAELKIDRRAKEWKGSPKGLSVELEKLKTNFKAIGIEIERGREHEGRYLNIYIKESSPLYNIKNCHMRHMRHGDESDESDEKITTLWGEDEVGEIEDGESINSEISHREPEKIKKKRASEGRVTNNKTLERTFEKVIFMTTPMEGKCERCGRETWLDHEWIDEDGDVRHICPECAAELKDEND